MAVCTYLLSVKEPPTRGPSTEDTPKAIPKEDVKMSRLRRVTRGTIIIMPPQNMPAAPISATARPTMKAVELGAAPYKVELTSKTTMLVRKTHLVW